MSFVSLDFMFKNEEILADWFSCIFQNSLIDIYFGPFDKRYSELSLLPKGIDWIFAILVIKSVILILNCILFVVPTLFFIFDKFLK